MSSLALDALGNLLESELKLEFLLTFKEICLRVIPSLRAVLLEKCAGGFLSLCTVS